VSPRKPLIVLAVAIASILGVVQSAQSTTSGTNGRILYQQQVHGKYQLFTVDADGTDRRQLTHGPTESLNGAWSPDGKSIVFERGWADHAGVLVMDADGSDVRVLTPTGLQGDPSFTPDGRQIVFTRTAVDQYDSVWVMHADGSDARELVATRNHGGQKCGCDLDPTVSPNGKTITYVRVKGDFGKDQRLMSIGLDGTGLKRLTSRSFEVAIKHDWSPNGKLIVFTSPGDPAPGKSANLWVMRPDGSHPRALTRFAGGDSHAFAGSFSPDGKWIVLRIEDAKGYHLSRIRPDGTGLHVLSTNKLVPQRASAWGTAP
jgi:Tol biopolymer transport system component